jgi:hypothetical protein
MHRELGRPLKISGYATYIQVIEKGRDYKYLSSVGTSRLLHDDRLLGNHLHLGFITATKRNDMPHVTEKWQNFDSQACIYKILGWHMLIVKQWNSIDYWVGPLVQERSYIWRYVNSCNIRTQEPHSSGRGAKTKMMPWLSLVNLTNLSQCLGNTNGRSVSERWPARDAEGNSNEIAEITGDLRETSETKPVVLHNQ